MTRIVRIALTGVVILALAGCSSGGSSDDAKDNGTDAPTTTVAGSGGNGEAPPSEPPATGQIDRDPTPEGTGIADTTEMESCDTEPGAVKAKGTVQLADGMEPGTAIVSVTWRNASTGTVLARTRVDVENVTADAATDWEVENLLPDNDVTVDCVVGSIVVD